MSQHDEEFSIPMTSTTTWKQATTTTASVKNNPTLTTSTTSKLVKCFLEVIRPALFTPRPPQKALSPTAYLDGIRGFAAFLVYWQHHQGWARIGSSANSIFENGYGYQDRYYFAAFPFIRLLFTGGHFAVPVFFVLSGYVLSLKPIALASLGDLLKLEDTLSSAMFRRWIRLHLPVIGTTFIYMTTWHVFGIWTSYPEHQATYSAEVVNWVKDFWRFSFIHRGDDKPWPIYNVHLWSISYEFKGSIVVYTTLLALSRFRLHARLAITSLLISYFLYLVDGWYIAMFLAGMLLCDLDNLSLHKNLPQFFHTTKITQHKTAIVYVSLIASLYLAGAPSYGLDIAKYRSTPGWYYLSLLSPSAARDAKWIYQFFASTSFITVVPHLPWLKRFFNCTFNQYLGRISFGLYLVHGPVLWVLGDRMYAAVGFEREAMSRGLDGWKGIWKLSKAGPLGLEFAFWVPQVLLLPVTLWMAEIVTRVFDEPSVRFAGWAYRRAVGSVQASGK